MSGAKKVIMIADDDPGIVDAVGMLLEFAGYEVRTETDGAKVLNMGDTLPDLLLLDVWMGEHDGREICMLLKHHIPTSKMPIIIVSANSDIAQAASYAGADDYLAKPFDMDELLQKISLHL